MENSLLVNFDEIWSKTCICFYVMCEVGTDSNQSSMLLCSLCMPFVNELSFLYFSFISHSLSFRQQENLLRMNTSVKLNELIVEKSHDASLVIVNLPTPPSDPGKEENCILPF